MNKKDKNKTTAVAAQQKADTFVIRH